MALENQAKDLHIAGGAHKGIVINKNASLVEEDPKSAYVSLEFCVFLVSAVTGMHTKESRQLRFWFKDSVAETDHPKMAQEFFKALVAPFEFPRDYVGFIKKIMKLVQHDYPLLRKVEVEMKQLGQSAQPLPTTAKQGTILLTVGVKQPKQVPGMLEDVHPAEVEVTSVRLLEMIESAYPNPLSITEMAKQTHSEKSNILVLLSELQSNGLIKTVGETESYTRVVQNENQVKVVKQMPKMVQAKQPTIAIITAQYCEKLAVDSMMDNQETFVRYTTVGESNVYTLGNIGAHRIVCTKLPTVGHTSREAMIAAGSTTTRLLGTFQAVEFVILVGVGGGIPHYTDYSRHVRLGDVVVSSPTPTNKAIYTYCELTPSKDEQIEVNPKYETKSWCPPNLALQDISARLKLQGEANPCEAVWNKYIEEGIKNLSVDGVNFARPSEETDKLYMSLGGSDVIEVTHPTLPLGSSDGRHAGQPVIHLGPIAAGRQVCKDDQLRQDFASRFGILAFDTEYDAVIESVFGNRKDCYVIIRGISDYKDGSRRKEWQPYASLAAAAFTKSVICALDASNSDD